MKKAITVIAAAFALAASAAEGTADAIKYLFDNYEVAVVVGQRKANPPIKADKPYEEPQWIAEDCDDDKGLYFAHSINGDALYKIDKLKHLLRRGWIPNVLKISYSRPNGAGYDWQEVTPEEPVVWLIRENGQIKGARYLGELYFEDDGLTMQWKLIRGSGKTKDASESVYFVAEKKESKE